MKNLVLLVVLFCASLVINAQTITITSPNGGQVWAGCTSHLITWNSSGVSNNYNIDYSIDNGNSWISVTSAIYITNGQYNWSVPNINSTSCLVRLLDSSNPSTSDISDMTFSITAPLILTIPNGGQTWEGGITQTINFVASGTTNYYDLFYSVNAGANWTSIASNQNITNGQYSWSVPNNPSVSCLVKIQDHTNTTCMVDVSDALFTITPATPVITITSPNTALTKYVGQSHTITWTSAYVTSNAITIDYSTDNGSTWIPIVTNTTNTGSYAWTIPNTPSTQCLVKVTDLGNPATYDVSNTTFTIASPFITVTYPNGGETFTGCSAKTITWTSGGTGTYSTIKYSTNNGATWTNIALSASGNSFNWSPVPSIDATQCLIKINDNTNTSVKDSSNAIFTINKNTDIIITAPNGSESWQVGTAQNITWVAAPTSTQFWVYYSTNNGSSWNNVTTSYTTSTTRSWTIPNNPGVNNLIMVEDYNNTCKYDISDAFFTIAPPTPVITVTAPNTSTTRYSGTSFNITWTSQYLASSFVTIEYSIDGGNNWLNVIGVTENDGTFAWTVPGTSSNQCRVRVSEYNNPSVFDISDVNFTIAPPFVTLTNMNGGESLTGCSSQSITWSSGGTSGNFTIQYSTNNGSNWTNITTAASGSAYTWNPVANVSSANCLIKVFSSANPAAVDSSNAVFSITPNTDIILTVPNGGESWQVGTSQNITWVAAPTSTQFWVYYSTNNGSTWSNVTTSYTSSTTRTWTIPNYPGTNNLIKVEDYNNTCKFDISDAVFTIAPPTPVITVTNPNNSTTRYVGATQTISWTSQYVTSPYVAIQYTTNGGSTWSDIASVTENDGSYSWIIPNTPSNQCKVKVIDYNEPTTFDESDVNFTIALPYVTVTAPNGGESWKGCSAQSIIWTSGGASGSYTIKYSTNNGVNWTNIVTNASGSSYSWNPLPNNPSTNCLIKVQDNSITYAKDSSNAVFTIQNNADIVVTAPNGAENWQVGTSQNITWVKEPTSTRFNVYYSTNNGTNWSTLTTYSSATSYTWTIPNAPSVNSLVKVEDYNNTCIYDISNDVFTIAPPSPYITVTNPNTATTRYAGNSLSITWTSQYLASSFVTIEYTIDGGTSWTTIAAITENDGSHAWVVPTTPSPSCRVRISEYNNPSVYDESDVLFPIALPYITVTAPNGGESWKGCSSQSITWTSGGASGSYAIKYSTNNGVNWTNIVTNASGSSYNWNPVANNPSANCLIKVQDNSIAYAKDSSNAVFTIQNNADIVVTAPNGAENWQVGTSQNITWVKEPTSTRFNVYYSTNNGTNWSTLTTYSSATSYAWTIPNAPSVNSLVKVEDYNNTCIFDISNDVFTIAPPNPVITVTTPNNSTTRYAGSNLSITWTSQYLTSSFVTIEYTIDGGSTWNNIIEITENDGSQAWIIPSTPSANCKVRISEYNNPAVYDESNVFFPIALPYITVTLPNGGESWEGCANKSVTFISGGTSSSFLMKYSTNNGATWINGGSTSGSPFSWTGIPNISSSQCLVKILDASNQSVMDSSNAPFSILSHDDIIVTAPNGGESWQVATTKNITWIADPSITSFTVSYSTNNGDTWTTLTSYTTANSYSWTIPNNPGAQYLIRVMDYNSSCRYDESDASFTVTPQPPAVTSPNGSETRYYGTNYNITWTNQYFNSTYVRIDLSVDSGMTWTPVANVTNNTGTYSWACPNTYSNKCLVKVSEYNNPTVYDISNAVFTIAPGLLLTTPNGDNGTEEWRVCTQTTIKWTAGGGSNYYKIEYSTNNGTNWTTIAANYYGTGNPVTYDWTIPNTPSTQCLVRVTDNSYLLKTDVSDATFSIQPSVTVTTPNGGESLSQGSNYLITWAAVGASSYFTIDYSTNGGSAWTNVIYNQNITNNQYSWTVPAVASSNCLIRVTDQVNTCKLDQSDNSFSIGMPQPTIVITAPNGGEVLSGCAVSNITWSATNTSGNYNIEYSTNNGSIWTGIVSNYNSAGGSYAWTVPNISSTQCLVRVRDFSNTSISDVSNTVFTMNPGVSATVTPGGPTTFCAGSNVTLTSGSATGNSWYPGGQTTQSITVSSTGSYYVVVTSGSCQATSNTVNVTVNPVPDAPVASSNSPVSLNGTINLYASTVPNASYSWTGPNTFSSVQQNPLIQNATSGMAGVYSVVAVVNGCSSTAGTTNVVIDPNPATVTVIGTVLTENGTPVGGVDINMTGSGTGLFTTAANGNYNLSMNQGGNYVLTPSKDNDVITNNGISTLDIILAQRHILGTQALNSSYKIIAADVNTSGTVSSLDLVLMRSVVLQSSTTFPNNALWTFANSSYVFPDAMNPFPYESTRAYSSADNLADQNFVGIKLGDVNNSWDPSVAKVFSNESVSFYAENITTVQGQEIIVPVKVSGFNSISGYQFTVNWNPAVLELNTVSNNELTAFYNLSQKDNGLISGLWSTENMNGTSLEDGSTVMYLHFTANGQPGSSCNVSISSSMTKTEAYNANLELLDVITVSGTVSIENSTSAGAINIEGYSLEQNVPNPFENTTEIIFSVPTDQSVKFEIYNYLGQKVYSHLANAKAGKNNFLWNTKDDNLNPVSAGTYYLKMFARDYSRAVKMIVIE
ncbi:MAG: hypothetical protein A2275_12175 [Bacteroidetes bacterium RIFOXYA12_FULL_35_11]|nr:MAG: hypothetical protein A2X01_01390 [Bacteroidetes bacterium GWF2_35_48]OFY77732.1 MAG: hypothetical protein A2275_12175 [Bacteroidetes bacterium RIFOXYA12_FULL_35_11]OFY98417.1 MAG: hypothetical protein A2491_14630 [Bacteroidetes bacterium RIFOXYC12_FULL_35_7]HBX51921.1 hypothetical protein [Bacteroidales bacterium]